MQPIKQDREAKGCRNSNKTGTIKGADTQSRLGTAMVQVFKGHKSLNKTGKCMVHQLKQDWEVYGAST